MATAAKTVLMPRTLAGLLLVSGLLATGAGCVTIGWSGNEKAPKVLPAQVFIECHNQVVFAPDPIRNGEPNPGLVARVRVFGPTIDFPLTVEGEMRIDLYDATQPGSAPLESWPYTPAMLEQFRRKDHLGDGFSVFFPWPGYRPDVTHPLLKLCFVPKGGTALYSECRTVLGGNRMLPSGAAMGSGAMPGHSPAAGVSMASPTATAFPGGPQGLRAMPRPTGGLVSSGPVNVFSGASMQPAFAPPVATPPAPATFPAPAIQPVGAVQVAPESPQPTTPLGTMGSPTAPVTADPRTGAREIAPLVKLVPVGNPPSGN